MIDILASVALLAILVGSHALAYRLGRRRGLACVPVETPAHAFAPPVALVVDNTQTPAAQHALDTLGADFAALPAYVDTLLRQIDGVKSDAETGIALVIDEVGQINAGAREQIGRMHASLDGSEALAQSSLRPREIIGRLEATLDARSRQVQANFDNLNQLAGQFDAIRPAIEAVAAIADKAYFLSINASVEAARAGSAGAAFGLVADEVRALSKLTQAASKQIGDGINVFTRRMQDELARVRPQLGSSGDEVGRLIGELGEIQHGLADAGGELTGMIQGMDAGHRQMVERLSTILGHVQFQDVIRQRLEQIAEAINDLGDHVTGCMAARRSGDCDARQTIEQRMIVQQASYVMHSQRAAFSAVAGQTMAADTAPRIELF
jgi:methyl-accepting chemotaxis protein